MPEIYTLPQVYYCPADEVEPASMPDVKAGRLPRGFLHHAETLENAPKTASPENTVELAYPGAVHEPERFSTGGPDAERAAALQQVGTTVRVILQHCVPEAARAALFGTQHHGLWRRITKAVNRQDVAELRASLAEFNAQLARAMAGAAPPSSGAAPPLVHHILEQSYSRAVAADADRLRQYKGFSNNVYGEIRPLFVDTFLGHVALDRDSVFLDMGSGIGNVVLQIAAQRLCASHGIEIMDIPAELASRQRAEFVARMRAYGLPCGPIGLIHGDFTSHPRAVDLIQAADVILVNNYAFDAALNHSILNLFLDLRDGTRVITLKALTSASDRRSLTHRNMTNVGNIFKVTEHYFPVDSVSWMSDGGKYFVHTVDRSWLAKRLGQVEPRRANRSSSSSASSRSAG